MQVCALRDAEPDFSKVGAKVFGMSTDGVEAQKKFADSTKVKYQLLADADKKVAKAYGVLRPKRGYARRVTFVVDAAGRIRHVFAKVNVRAHGAEVVEVLKKLGAAPGGDTGHTGVLDEEAFKSLHELKSGAAPKLLGKDIDLGGSKAYLSVPKGKGPHPGVLVIHEWWGLNNNVKHWADRLAADGYAALAIDLYGGNVAKIPDDAIRYMRGVKDEEGAAIIAKGLKFLAEDSRIKAKKRAAIGWCFGGGWSLRAALAHSDLDAAVIYYGRLKTDPAVLSPIKAKVLGVFANQDRGIPPATVDAFEKALKTAGVDATIHRYDANHAFANPSSARYNKTAAADAWQKVRAFLKKDLK